LLSSLPGDLGIRIQLLGQIDQIRQVINLMKINGARNLDAAAAQHRLMCRQIGWRPGTVRRRWSAVLRLSYGQRAEVNPTQCDRYAGLEKPRSVCAGSKSNGKNPTATRTISRLPCPGLEYAFPFHDPVAKYYAPARAKVSIAVSMRFRYYSFGPF
jgi:hypothetical protein